MKYAWDQFWFQEGSAESLGLFRIFSYLSALCFLFAAPYFNPADVNQSFYSPTFFFQLLHVPQFSFPELQLLKILGAIFLTFSAVGIGGSISRALSFLTIFCYLGGRYNYGAFGQDGGTFTLTLLIMVAAPCGHAFSVDSLISKRTQLWPFKTRHYFAGQYRWPLQFFKLYWAFIFFSAFLFKLLLTGHEWFTSNMLRQFMVLYWNYFELEGATILGGRLRKLILQYYWIGRALTLGTIVLECAMPLVLFSKRARFPLIACGAGMLIGIRIIMGHGFYLSMAPMLLGWLPWEKLAHCDFGAEVASR